MKRITRITHLSAALAIAVGIQALNVAAAGHTNAVQTINLQLVFLTQGPYKTNSPATNEITATAITNAVATKDVIAWLGTATTNNFPATAKLVRVIHFGGGENSITYEVRFGTNSVDVSQFIQGSTSSERIDESTYYKISKLSTGKLFENLHFVVTNAPPYNLIPYFHVAGAATVTFALVTSGRTTLAADVVSAPNLAGAGARTNGVPALVTGSYTITGTVTEVK